MYSTIVNPKSGRSVNIHGITGRKVLQKYGIQYGGQGKSTNKNKSKNKSKNKRSPKNVQKNRSSKTNIEVFLRDLFR